VSAVLWEDHVGRTVRLQVPSPTIADQSGTIVTQPAPDRELGRPLSPRQQQAVETICLLGTYELAARDMGCVVPTLKNYMTQVYRRLGVPNIGAACYLIGLEHGRAGR